MIQLRQVLKPHYLYRPQQLCRRVRRFWSRPSQPVLVKLPWGVKLEVNSRETIGAAIWQLGVYDLPVSETIWRLLQPGETAIDVGANIGYMSSLMARRVGPGGRVLAFEPHPQVNAALQRNLARMLGQPQMGSVHSHQEALAEHRGSAWLSWSESFSDNQGTAKLGTPSEVGIKVPTTTLDDVVGGSEVALVKIDVEGAEQRVLTGGSQSLRDGRIRDLVYECFAPSRASVRTGLRGFGYEIFGLGMNFRGLLLQRGDSQPRLPPFEAPSYLATKDPQRAMRLLEPAGWRVLHAKY